MAAWPHAPAHWLFDPGLYIITAGIYQKQHLLNSPERLDLVLDGLFTTAKEFQWELRAWSVLSNHYHFVARSPDDPATLRRVLGKLHMTTAKTLNQRDGTPGRKVWFQFWDSRITYERSCLARLKYVHLNPLHHGIVEDASAYRWCSAAWFNRIASPAFVKTVNSLKVDRVNVYDDF